MFKIHRLIYLNSFHIKPFLFQIETSLEYIKKAFEEKKTGIAFTSKNKYM